MKRPVQYFISLPSAPIAFLGSQRVGIPVPHLGAVEPGGRVGEVSPSLRKVFGSAEGFPCFHAASDDLRSKGGLGIRRVYIGGDMCLVSAMFAKPMLVDFVLMFS